MSSPNLLQIVTNSLPNISMRVVEKSQASNDRSPLLALRLVTLVILVTLLTMHIRSLRIFRFEQSVSGGVLVTYCFAALGLALSAGIQNSGGRALQVYLCGSGAALLTVNAAVIWHRWHRATDMTRVIAELLRTLGLRLRRQVLLKVLLSAMAATALLIDIACIPLWEEKR